jgi:hypothetical protein
MNGGTVQANDCCLCSERTGVSIFLPASVGKKLKSYKKTLGVSFMKSTFKPLGLAAAVAAGTLGMTGAAHGVVAANNLGDLAIVPYYTVQGDYVTGLHIINTDAVNTIVTKVRFRRGSDSADALDFNVILSPNDMWTGFVNNTGANGLRVNSTDNSCTVPNLDANNGLDAPAVNNVGAEEGYIEIIGMGAATAAQPISVDALHAATGIPADCTSATGAASNFFAASVVNSASTNDHAAAASTYADVGNVLKVSAFIRDTASGMEFGSNATHIANFAAAPMMTNQQTGVGSGDTNGFDFPDLDGGGNNGAPRGLYDTVIRVDLGVTNLINDWSFNAANGVATDWVVTIPGQYLMVNPSDATWPTPAVAANDNRDLPVNVTVNVTDREEQQPTAAPGQLVVSPNVPGVVPTTQFSRETNVVEWGGQSVFGSATPISITPGLSQSFGWAALGVTEANANAQLIYDLRDQTGATSAALANVPVPMTGFVAWQRTFNDPNLNYGRIIAHSTN